MVTLKFYLLIIIISFLLMIYGKYSKDSYVDIIGKMICSIFILATAYLISTTYYLRFGFLLPIAMLCGVSGDWFLGIKDKPFIKNTNRDKCFLIGLISFFIGHIFYLIAFLNIFTFVKGQIFLAIIGALIFTGIIFAIDKSKIVDLGEFRYGCMAYGFLLSFLVLVTFFIAINLFNIKGLLLFISALLFIISDLILMVIYFSPKKKSDKQLLIFDFFNLLTYFAAQYGFIALPMYICLL